MKNSIIIALLLFGTVFAAGSPAGVILGATPTPVPVTTYHYDNLRTGWNKIETTLNQTNVNQTQFGILNTVVLDEQVDAQPLVVPNQTIAGGQHEVVYVATENNTIYAIDASSGAILVSRHLGAPVPRPLKCGTNGPNVGINSTPVIDLSAQIIYVMAYLNTSPPTYQLHALKLSDLTDKLAPVTVAASHKLTNGAQFTFNASVQRQRPALVEANGNIYAGFGSFCDFHADASRGWLLGWSASTLAPRSGNQLDDTQASSPTSFFLSSIWMSGSGIAAAHTSLYFATGNSDCNFYLHPELCPTKTTYDGVTNIQESVVGINQDLTNQLRVYTPSNVAALDMRDKDVGSGGVMLLPDQSGAYPVLAVAGGKDGRLFLFNRINYKLSLLDSKQLSGCFCAPIFFTGPDQIGRIVTSEGSKLQTWLLEPSPAPHLVSEATTGLPVSNQDPGFFTSVSTNGTTSGTGIIWAVGRPTKTTSVTLYAFAAQASNGANKLLFSSPAGSWPHTGGNANIVPVVANGKVYVAANQLLTIFGILPGNAPRIASQQSALALQPSPIASPDSPHIITGALLAVDGKTLTLQTRNGKKVKVDDTLAVQKQQIGVLVIGAPFTAEGSSYNPVGALQATSIFRAKGSSGALAPADR